MNDLEVLTVGWAFVLLATVIGVFFVVEWMQGRTIAHELAVGIDKHAVERFLPGVPGNPPLVYFLELQYQDRLHDVVMMHGLCTVKLTDGTLILHGRRGQSLGRPFHRSEFPDLGPDPDPSTRER